MEPKVNLPNKIPIFPLLDFIFFPKTSVPLNIFEPRYLEMVNDSIKNKRIIGMVQPQKKIKTINKNKKELYTIGCAGKIISFNETDDNRIEIILNGISRFKIVKEIISKKLYREFDVNYEIFKNDSMQSEKKITLLNSKLLLKEIKFFFEKKNYVLNWNELENQNIEQVVNTLCMISPISSEEKQMLLESKNLEDRSNEFIKIVKTYSTSNFQVNTLQ